MEIKNAIKTITQAANLESCTIAKELGISRPAYALFINGKLNQVDRLIKICEICGCQLQITNNNGLTLKLDTAQKNTPE